jgi:hypothetical protein
MSVDYAGLVALRDKLTALQGRTDAFLKECADELCANLLAKARKRTPVWNPTRIRADLAKMDEGVEQQTYKFQTPDGKRHSYKILRKGEAIWSEYWAGHMGGFLRESWTPIAARRIGNNYVAVLNNGAAYAMYVEHGHYQTPGRYVGALGVRLKNNWVPGRHMLRISEDELRREMDAILQKKQDAWLRKALEGVMD